MGKESIRILHIDTGKTWRGGQQQVAYLLEAMNERGFHTALVCPPKSSLEKFCHDKSIPCMPIKMLGELDVLAGCRISQICRNLDFNILHLHSGHALSIGLWAKIFLPKLKLITVRRVAFHIKKNWFSQLKYKNRLLDKIVCISHEIEKVLLQDGVTSDKLVTIHSGVDIRKFDNVLPASDFRQRLGVAANHILVGTIAAMAKNKGYPNLLKAAKIVTRQIDNVTFCAVGDGPDREKIIKMADEFGVKNHFIFTGYREDIGNFLKTFDIFVLASRKEGLGTSILDAQAVGLPVIACAAGGTPEIISDGKNGLLVPPNNEQRLAEAVVQLINNPQLKKTLGRNAKQTVKRFDIHYTIEKNIKLYEQMLS
jgi:glycosyltransferase involved in cell wall biosynthesis